TPKDDPKLYGAGILDAGASAARTHWMHVVMRLGALLALAGLVGRAIRKRNGRPAKSLGVALAALVGAVGLLPIAPMLPLTSAAGALRWVVELAMRPLGEWDLAWGASLHRWLPLANALPAMVATAFLFGANRVRPLVGAFALGSAALMAQLAF